MTATMMTPNRLLLLKRNTRSTRSSSTSSTLRSLFTHTPCNTTRTPYYSFSSLSSSSLPWLQEYPRPRQLLVLSQGGGGISRTVLQVPPASTVTAVVRNQQRNSTSNSGNSTPTTSTGTTGTTATPSATGANKLLRSLSSLPIQDDHHDNEDDVNEGRKNIIVPTATEITNDSQSAQKRKTEHYNDGEATTTATATTTITTSTASTTTTTTTTSPSHVSYLADTDVTFPITSDLKIIKPSDDEPSGVWPVYRIMDEDGTFRTEMNDGYKTKNTEREPEQRRHQSYDDYEQHLNHECDHDGGRDIHALKRKLIKDHPQHEKSIQSSLLFHLTSSLSSSTTSTSTSTSTNYYKSFAETFSSIHEKQNDKNNNIPVLLRAHRVMTRLRQMDDVLLNAQRQGRISFYLTCRGEEGIHIGSASALSMDDVVLAQYREQGILMWRGFTLDQFTNQCFTNDLDLGRGRQMPIHYGSRALNYHTISSPLGTQLPQAVGVAYKMKLDKLAKNSKNEVGNDNNGSDSISIVYFGDGAASTTDFHAALNFAATLKVPTIFFCRNNGYAISTKTTDQYASDGVVCRSRGYGMAAIRVDGNDVFAVHSATKAAREYAIQHSEPVLIEAISYRQGHHSTSDDSYQYRSVDEVNNSENVHDPLRRFEQFLLKQNWMDESDLSTIKNEERVSVLKALERSEKRPQPKLETMFQDVYKEMPLNLVMQEKLLQKHMKKYPEKY